MPKLKVDAEIEEIKDWRVLKKQDIFHSEMEEKLESYDNEDLFKLLEEYLTQICSKVLIASDTNTCI